MKPTAVQVSAINKLGPMLRNQGGGAAFMDMGLGKTLVACLLALDLDAEGLIDGVIVVSPNTFKQGWAEEVEKHKLPIDTFLYSSRDRKGQEQWLRKTTDRLPMTVINYESMRIASGRDFLHRCIDGQRYFVIYDESIQLKGHKSLQTKAAIALSKACPYKLVLTGKPIVQGPHDLWGQMRSIGHLDGFNYFTFRNAFCRMGGYMGKNVIGAVNEDKLAELLEPWVFEAKKDASEFPKLYSPVPYDLGPALTKHYEDMYGEFVVWLSENETVAVDVALAKYAKLQQIQCGFIIDENKRARDLVPLDENPRLNLVKALAKDQIEGKFCVVYHNRHCFNQLMEALAEYNPAFIAGGMSDGEVAENKARFNADKNCGAILLQTKAAKYGHTLLGDQSNRLEACAEMVFYQSTYSLDDRSQIEDRINRFGQQYVSHYTDLYGTPIDRDVAEALQRKENIGQAFSKALRRLSGVETHFTG